MSAATDQKRDQKRDEQLGYARGGEPRSKRDARLRKSVSRWARFWGRWYYIPMVLGLLLLPLGRCGMLLSPSEEKSAGMVLALLYATVLAVMILALAITFFAMRREVTRWRAEQAAMPFRVVELEDCLSDDPRESSSYLELHFTFAGAPPTAEELERSLLASELGWTVKYGTTRARLSPGRGGDAYPGDNRLLAEWFANLASGALVGIHTRFPIASVRVVNGRWDP